MPIRTAIWKVGSQPQPLAPSLLAGEQLLEDMTLAAPRMLSDEGMLMGRQEVSGDGMGMMRQDTATIEPGLFGNQNTVCRPTARKWRSTVERLKQRFPDFDQVGV